MDDASPRQPLTPREVSARSLPVPSTASPQLQAFIAAAANATAAGSAAPQSAEAWRAMAAVSDARAIERLGRIRALFPCEVATKDIASVTVRTVTPASLDPAKADRVLVHLQGGGYVTLGGEAGLPEAVLCAHYAKAPVLSVDYRMPPDHPFPAAVDDAVAVWRALIADHSPAAIGVFGTSAGGGLVLAMTLELKALGLPLPGALAASTPWADLGGKSDSYAVNAGVDGVIARYEGVMEGMARLYAGAAPLSDPLVSPVLGDFAGFPPSILTTGTRDILLSDTVRVYRAMRAAGVEARLEVHEAMSHAEYNYCFDSPESATVFGDIARFFEQYLAK